ncbi:MAG: OmpH family outer membrane protein [Desulfomonilaceae bacterium]
MSRSLLGFVLALFTAVVLCSTVAQAESLSVAFVDFQKLEAKSKKAQDLQKKLTDMSNVKRNDLEKKKNELVNLQEQLQKQGPMLKEETRNDKIKEIGVKEMELKLAQKAAETDLQNEFRAAQELMMRDINKIISEIRVQKKLSMVLNSMAILSADDAFDITDEVISLYDGTPSGKPAAEKPKPPAAPAKPKAPAAR